LLGGGIRFEHASSDHALRFVDFENTVAATIAQHHLTGDAIDLAVRGADFGDIRPASR
jgi:dihydroorotase